jgi:hypothetical protein
MRFLLVVNCSKSQKRQLQSKLDFSSLLFFGEEGCVLSLFCVFKCLKKDSSRANLIFYSLLSFGGQDAFSLSFKFLIS